MSAVETFHNTIAFQLAAALDAYQADVGALLRTPSDAELYQRVNEHLNQMRVLCERLPTLSACWVEVLIRHYELTHAISLGQGTLSVDVERLQVRHAYAVQNLMKLCVHLVPSA